MLPNSPMKADKKIRCGNYICFILKSGLRITFGMDKAIAHTKGYVKSHYGLYKPTMWCYRYYLHSNIKVAKFDFRR